MLKAKNNSDVEILDWRSKSISSLPVMTGMLAPQRPGGQTLPQLVPTQRAISVPAVVRRVDPSNNAIAVSKRGVLSGFGDPMNQSTTLDASRIQAALRMAERGDTWQLFTIFRDMEAGYSHLQAEFAKRKLTVVGQPHTILPKNKKNRDDVIAAEVIDEMIEHCDNWDDALSHLLSAALWPVAVMEKLFLPVDSGEKASYAHPVRYRLRKLDPVNPTLFCYKIPYLSAGIGGPPLTQNQNNFRDLGDQAVYNPDAWEPELRFYEVYDNGYPDFAIANTYAPDQNVHLVYRGNNLSKTIRDNFGCHMRAILFWWYLATNARDWWGRYTQRWGHPFILGKVDAQQKDTLQFMQAQLSMSLEIGGLIIDKNAEAQLLQAAALNGAEGYKIFVEFANEEVSKVVVGQTLSSSAKPTGLGSGVANLQGQVRDDYRQSDARKLSTALVNQLFKQYLRINGYKGNIKGIIWGGKNEQQAKELSEAMKNFKAAGLEADDSGIETISERTGISLQRAPEPPVAAPGASPVGGVQRVKTSNSNKPKPKKQVATR